MLQSTLSLCLSFLITRHRPLAKRLLNFQTSQTNVFAKLQARNNERFAVSLSVSAKGFFKTSYHKNRFKLWLYFWYTFEHVCSGILLILRYKMNYFYCKQNTRKSYVSSFCCLTINHFHVRLCLQYFANRPPTLLFMHFLLLPTNDLSLT